MIILNYIGYYSAYDHVCLSQLFGKMINLPKHFPMYTNDLQQYLDYFGITLTDLTIEENKNKHDALSDAKWNLNLYHAIKIKYGVKI